jgi:hypothetical protein
MKWTQEESRRRDKIIAERRKEFTYEITISPEEWELLRHATLLNRRMLDRGFEHTLLDKAFTCIMEKCAEKFNGAFEPFEPYDR